MLSPKLIGRCVILGFMLLVGYSIAKSIDAGSPLGLLLAIVSLCAGIRFVHLLGKVSEQHESP